MNELILLEADGSLMSVIMLRLESVVHQHSEPLVWTSASSQETSEPSKPDVMNPSAGKQLL